MEWIKVRDRFPEPANEVLTWNFENGYRVMWYHGTHGWSDNEGWVFDNDLPTHWMPLPKIPQQ